MPARATENKSIDTQDAVIETLIDGSGPTLVVLPSYGRDSREDFNEFAGILSDAGYRVLRPQPRGIGRSVGSMETSLEGMAADVAEVIRQLGGGQAAVLGHAFGNGVARQLATTHKDLVAGTVLAAASTSGASAETNEAPFIAGDPTRSEHERLAVLRRAFFATGHDARIWLDGWYPKTLEMQKAAAQRVDPKSFSHAGTAPILQIIAESDPFSPYETWRSLREECGDRVTTRIIADASHALFPEQTPNVAKVVLEWLAQLPKSFTTA